MKTYTTNDLNMDACSDNEVLWVYNGLDCMLTEEIRQIIEPHLDPLTTGLTYGLEVGLQGPAMEMCVRGIKIDLSERNRRVEDLKKRILLLKGHLNTLAEAVWGKPLNHNSPKQMKEFFYLALGCPKQYTISSGARKVTTNREALEKLSIRYDAKIFCKIALRLRDLTKTIGTLNSAVDNDGRMRTLYAVAGTETGRWASRANAFGSGTNLQNITDKIRSIFVANPGHKLAYIDLEQAESRAVAYLSGDNAYIKACEGGDLHTTVSNMVWPDGNPKETYYRDFTRRDISKRLGHGTNYWGKAPNMAKQTHIDRALVAGFQTDYFTAFPGITDWHNWVITEIQTEGFLTTPLMRKRKFWGRLTDDSTIRKAIAYGPQSLVGDCLNIGMYRLWKYAKKSVLMAQIHDAVLIQYPEDNEEEALREAMSLIEVPIPVVDYGPNPATRLLIIPAAVEGTGWNWGKQKTNNPDGLKPYAFGEPDRRTRTTEPPASFLDQRVF